LLIIEKEKERERGREEERERKRDRGRERDQAIIKYSMDMKNIKTENVRNWQQRVRRKYTVHEMNLHDLVQNHGSWMDI
jgi:RNA processing factor Prp31